MPPGRDQLPLRHAVALGLAQGPAELLPVSSSAHTTLLPWLAGWPYAELDGELRKTFEVALHAGAAFALAIVMRGELRSQAAGLLERGPAGMLERRPAGMLERRAAGMRGPRASVLALSLAPPAIAGYALRGTIERRLGGPRSIAAALVAGAAAMAIADAPAVEGSRGIDDVRPADGLALGLAQALALIPGISRSGATLTAARGRGFARDDAQALSWSVALPVILGAGALQAPRLAGPDVRGRTRTAMGAGAGAAFLSTLASAKLLGPRRSGGRALLPYSLYRAVLAAVVVRRLRRAQ